ncbi:MAG: hypothetical protein ACI37T_08265, partial [Candidatus Gastranaerophilaceae bacterium]
MSAKNNKIILLSSFFVTAVLVAGVIFGAKLFNHSDKPSFNLNLTTEELEKRTNPDYLININLLGENSPEYKNLKQGDKEALKHLVKAAEILQNIQLQLDNRSNLAFRDFLVEQAKSGNKDALMTLTLFNAQRGMNAIDREANHIELAKNHSELLGKGFY